MGNQLTRGESTKVHQIFHQNHGLESYFNLLVKISTRNA